MTDHPYSKREQDLIFQAIKEEMQALNTNMDAGFKGVHARLDVTNGKVKKIIVALVAVFFFSLGLGFEQLSPLVRLLL